MYQSAGLLRKNRGLNYQAASPHLGAAHLPLNICPSIQVHLRKCFPPLASDVLVLTSKLQRASLQRVDSEWDHTGEMHSEPAYLGRSSKGRSVAY